MTIPAASEHRVAAPPHAPSARLPPAAAMLRARPHHARSPKVVLHRRFEDSAPVHFGITGNRCGESRVHLQSQDESQLST
jgi:hypothetical protein